MTDDSAKIAFHKTVRKLFRPLVRMAIKRGISVNDVYLWLKSIYVEEAESFKIEGKKLSASRIAMLTGLDRKEVAKLREINQDMDALLNLQTKRTNRALRAINGWQQDSDYLHEGTPKQLPLYGSTNSFESLTSKYCGDVSFVTILGELQQTGLIEVDDQDMVSLKNTSYVPKDDNNQLLSLMGQAGQDLLNTAAHNIENLDEASRLQLSVAYTQVPDHVRHNLKQLIETDSLELLKKIDGWFQEQLTEQSTTDTQLPRAGIGIYYFEEPNNSEPNS